LKGVDLRGFAALCGGVYSGPEGQIKGFSFDNREVSPGDLFIAVKGANVDAYDFVPQALAAGAIAAMVERPAPGPHILVGNIVQALARMAAQKRSAFRGPVVAVTGSAGKTTTKEFIAAALAPLGPVLKTSGNRNSEFSGPLLWAELDDSHQAIVVEMGMRGFGQIAHLASFTKPTIGVVTNIGVSHMEMVGDRAGIARAKSELLEALPATGASVLWAEDPFVETLRAASAAPVKTFGYSQSADCRIVNYTAQTWNSAHIEGKYHEWPFHATLPAAGKHIALNAAAAVLVASLAGVHPSDAADGLDRAELPPLRMEVLNHEGITIVLDAYNASPPSVVAALQTLGDMPTPGRRFAVLGEMKELGPYSETGHREVGEALATVGVERALLMGDTREWIGEGAHAAGMPSSRIAYADRVEEVGTFIRSLKPGDTVLIKGSRALGLERALQFLKEPVS
jgi:UDP-N-acetylmuramoyl-tripeptide--D-alanyl-D-alanine ligase